MGARASEAARGQGGGDAGGAGGGGAIAGGGRRRHVRGAEGEASYVTLWSLDHGRSARGETILWPVVVEGLNSPPPFGLVSVSTLK